MKQVTDEQFQKILLIDKIFGSVSIETLREFSESEQIVARLKGNEDNPQLLLSLIHERDISFAANLQNKSDIDSLKQDVKDLVKAVNILFSHVPPYTNELSVLKSKYGIY